MTDKGIEQNRGFWKFSADLASDTILGGAKGHPDVLSILRV